MNLSDFTPADISKYAFCMNAALATKLEGIIAPEINKTSKAGQPQYRNYKHDTYDAKSAERVSALKSALTERNWQTAKELQPIIGLTIYGTRSFLSYAAAANGITSKIVSGKKYFGLPDGELDLG